MEPLGSIGSIPPKAAGSSHPTASTGKTVMLLSAKLIENLPGKTALCFLPPAGQLLGRERVEGACRERPSASPRHGCAAWSRAPAALARWLAGAGPWLGRRCPQLPAGCPSGSSLGLACGAALEFGFASAWPAGGEQKPILQSKHGGKWGWGWEEGVGRSEGF